MGQQQIMKFGTATQLKQMRQTNKRTYFDHFIYLLSYYEKQSGVDPSTEKNCDLAGYRAFSTKQDKRGEITEDAIAAERELKKRQALNQWRHIVPPYGENDAQHGNRHSGSIDESTIRDQCLDDTNISARTEFCPHEDENGSNFDRTMFGFDKMGIPASKTLIQFYGRKIRDDHFGAFFRQHAISEKQSAKTARDPANNGASTSFFKEKFLDLFVDKKLQDEATSYKRDLTESFRRISDELDSIEFKGGLDSYQQKSFSCSVGQFSNYVHMLKRLNSCEVGIAASRREGPSTESQRVYGPDSFDKIFGLIPERELLDGTARPEQNLHFQIAGADTQKLGTRFFEYTDKEYISLLEQYNAEKKKRGFMGTLIQPRLWTATKDIFNRTTLTKAEELLRININKKSKLAAIILRKAYSSGEDEYKLQKDKETRQEKTKNAEKSKSMKLLQQINTKIESYDDSIQGYLKAQLNKIPDLSSNTDLEDFLTNIDLLIQNSPSPQNLSAAAAASEHEGENLVSQNKRVITSLEKTINAMFSVKIDCEYDISGNNTKIQTQIEKFEITVMHKIKDMANAETSISRAQLDSIISTAIQSNKNIIDSKKRQSLTVTTKIINN